MTDTASIRSSTSGNIASSSGDKANRTDQDVGAVEAAVKTINHNQTAKIQDTKQGFHPFVHWAQSQTHISLRIDLTQVENIDISISDSGSSLNFTARGRGAQGLQNYQFALDFYSTVDREVDCHSIERYVLVSIKKTKQQADSNWPRLTKQQLKFPWLRVDFDRYHTGDSDDSSDNDANKQELLRGKQSYDLLRQQLDEAKQQRLEQEPESSIWKSAHSWYSSLSNILKRNNRQADIYQPSRMKHDYRKETVAVDNSKNIARHALNAKKTYLFLYNLVMFIMFLKVYIVLLVKGLSGTVDDDIVQGAAFIIKVLTYTQLLESIHPMLGLVPGGPLMPFTQVIGRLLVNHFLTEPEIRLDSAPYAHYLFVVWSSIEIFRYSFYAVRVFKVNIYPLTWCRYTLFMPLYPMGGFCESMVIFSTIKFYEKTGAYSISLPNSANISFNLPIALKIYTFLLLGPTIYFLMRYMWTQRCKQLKAKVA